LLHRPEARELPKVADIKVSYSTFESLSSEQRMDALAYELDRQRGSRAGIDRFEGLLEQVELSGSYPKQLATNIYEMQQVRNVFAHKRGIADGRFVTACPYLGYDVGDRLVIDREAWTDFTVTAVAYAGVILYRVQEQLGMSVAEPTSVVSPIRYKHLATR
jgi:hypothetical protein